MASDEDLADELRALALRLHEVRADADRRAAAYEHLRHALDLLSEGERRLRWYEQDKDADGRRARNRDLSAWSGQLNVVAPPIRLELGERNGQPAMLGHVRLTRLREGPPGSGHGGVLAGLFDEVMGAAQRLGGGEGGMTGRLTVHYRKPTPLETDLLFRAWIHDERPTRVIIRAESVLAASVADGGGGEVTANADGFFVRPRR
ncbi:MAG: PaaI family thioesterase [Acidimicrobiales bacterium]